MAKEEAAMARLAVKAKEAEARAEPMAATGTAEGTTAKEAREAVMAKVVETVKEAAAMVVEVKVTVAGATGVAAAPAAGSLVSPAGMMAAAEVVPLAA
jgi:hypothetical protein